ncbi:zinc finger CCCH domain-containing protein 17-like [Zingiber officinale]|uniref:zinc finger CCCH domain-containing protein 17-like n=1 Tax=Zingiber officinale TaxID=94328 RepID=UPI001C4B2DB3|nr:zinc finger CCCH domain-containing protein 17-like [Zingiber officinale]
MCQRLSFLEKEVKQLKASNDQSFAAQEKIDVEVARLQAALEKSEKLLEAERFLPPQSTTLFSRSIAAEMESCVLHRNKRVVLQKPPVAVPCVFWRAGRCNRRPCRFLHAEQPPSAPEKNTKRNLQTPLSSPATNGKRNLQTPLSSPATNAKRNLQPPFALATKGKRNLEPPYAPVTNDKHDLAWRGDNTASSVVLPHASSVIVYDKKNKIAADRDTVRNESNCSLLATIRGHQQAISGIALASDTNRLLLGSKDGTISVWDSLTGQRVRVNIMGAEVGALLTEQHWSFMGVFDSFQAYNSHTKTQYIIEELGGQVHAIAASNGFVFAGIQDGSILAWQFNSEELITEQPMASLDGHLLPVVSLLVHEDIYSGSTDHTIKVWDLTSLQCIQTINGHTSSVMSLLSWGPYILSCSLDNSIKIWATSEGSQQLQLVYTHQENNGVISLCGISDANAKSVLICARSDRSICLYDLPSFTQRGQIHFSEELKVVKSDPSGLFFTGDATGELRVWSLSG